MQSNVPSNLKSFVSTYFQGRACQSSYVQQHNTARNKKVSEHTCVGIFDRRDIMTIRNLVWLIGWNRKACDS